MGHKSLLLGGDRNICLNASPVAKYINADRACVNPKGSQNQGLRPIPIIEIIIAIMHLPYFDGPINLDVGLGFLPLRLGGGKVLIYNYIPV